MKLVWGLRFIGNILTFIVFVRLLAAMPLYPINRFGYGGKFYPEELILLFAIMISGTILGITSEIRAKIIEKKKESSVNR